MAKTPRCRFCGREHYGVCNPSLGEGRLGYDGGVTVPVPVGPTLGQVEKIAAAMRRGIQIQPPTVEEKSELVYLRAENLRQADEIKALKVRIAELSRENEALRVTPTVTQTVTRNVTADATERYGVTLRNANAERQKRWREKQKAGA